jgi:hypothetical protein
MARWDAIVTGDAQAVADAALGDVVVNSDGDDGDGDGGGDGGNTGGAASVYGKMTVAALKQVICIGISTCACIIV